MRSGEGCRTLPSSQNKTVGSEVEGQYTSSATLDHSELRKCAGQPHATPRGRSDSLVNKHGAALVVYYLGSTDTVPMLCSRRRGTGTDVIVQGRCCCTTWLMFRVRARSSGTALGYIAQVDTAFLEQRLVVSQPIIEDLVFDVSSSSLWQSRWLEDAVHPMINTWMAGSLPVALDFALSAAYAGKSRSARGTRGRGGRCGRHTSDEKVMRV
jgi:hypothetical protein